MQGQQPVLRQMDQSPILQQPGNIVIKMNENIQPITTVGKCNRPLHRTSNIEYQFRPNVNFFVHYKN